MKFFSHHTEWVTDGGQLHESLTPGGLAGWEGHGRVRVRVAGRAQAGGEERQPVPEPSRKEERVECEN